MSDTKSKASDIDLLVTAVDQIQETLEEHTTALHHLEQRPIVDLQALEDRLKETTDAMDRLTRQRLPKLVSRHWWLCWLWLGTGMLLGATLCWWATQTPLGKQAVSKVWPMHTVQPVVPVVRKK